MVNQFSFNLDQNYLSHHGVKGQKWGVRRYQNYDGTLTAAGRDRNYNRKRQSINGKEYLTTEEQKQIVKRIISYSR